MKPMGKYVAFCLVWKCAMHQVLLVGIDLHLPFMLLGIGKPTAHNNLGDASGSALASPILQAPDGQMVIVSVDGWKK